MKIKKFNEKKDTYFNSNESSDSYYEELGYDESVVSYLASAYQLWTDAEGLPSVSADEHDRSNLTTKQKEYLDAFIKFWDISCEFEDKYYTPNYLLDLKGKKYNL